MPIKTKAFRKLMLIATQEIFMFDGKLYKQIEHHEMGLPDRSPLDELPRKTH